MAALDSLLTMTGEVLQDPGLSEGCPVLIARIEILHMRQAIDNSNSLMTAFHAAACKDHTDTSRQTPRGADLMVSYIRLGDCNEQLNIGVLPCWQQSFRCFVPVDTLHWQSSASLAGTLQHSACMTRLL